MDNLAHSYFEFSEEIISTVIKEIGKSEKYIRIAMFQIHHEAIFKLLCQKRDEGIEIEILTLPYDSINDDVSDEVIQRFEDLKNKKAKIEFIKWNVGDPERTTTAVGRWYLFHGKFIVTDNCAIALSANLTSSAELDAVFVTSDAETIDIFNKKFDYIRKLFVSDEIRRMISTSSPDKSVEIFQRPATADQRHEGYWIKHYPVSLCETNSTVQTGLYITPFDKTGRSLYEFLVKDAQEYVYISTESFTDIDFTDFLVNSIIQKKMENDDFKLCILTGLSSMDFSDRVQKAMRILLANGADMYTTSKELHAKFIITDQLLAISSINLNKINLGFYKTREFWRENTESVFVVRNISLIASARDQFMQELDVDTTKKVQDELVRKITDEIHTVFRGGFNFTTESDAKTIMGKFLINEEIQAKRTVFEIAKGISKLKDFNQRKTVTSTDVKRSIVHYLVSEGLVDYSQLASRVQQFDDNFTLDEILESLQDLGIIKIKKGKIELIG